MPPFEGFFFEFHRFTVSRYILSNFLGGGFKDFLFLPLPGEMIQFD